MEYRVSITEDFDWRLPSAYIEINGFQTEMAIQAWVFGNANYVEIVFDGDGYIEIDPKIRSLFRHGEIILSFTRDGDDIYTTWGRLQPMLPGNSGSGIYFEKAE
jgi:hypothetical protein